MTKTVFIQGFQGTITEIIVENHDSTLEDRIIFISSSFLEARRCYAIRYTQHREAIPSDVCNALLNIGTSYV